ncbi:MAG: hypothetical protein H7X95_04720, partial [Deltaproteobacteria bacterium]|nr:hypothetical protein [Deltaproteobacteria bacterium]
MNQNKSATWTAAAREQTNVLLSVPTERAFADNPADGTAVANGVTLCWNVPVVLRRRIPFAVVVSLGLHVLAGVVIVGSSLWRGWPAAPMDVEIMGMRLEDLQDLPLGAPPSGGAAGDPIVAPARAVAAASADTPEKDPAHAKPKPKLKPKTKVVTAPAAASDVDGGAAPPRPTSVRSYAPAGSRVTALMRVDRLRDTVYAPAVDALLLNLPDRRDLLEGTGVDLYRDIDAILIATPNPLDARVTFLAVRHRLTDAAMRAALDRGARATNRKLAWRTERGRPFAERRSAGPATGDSPENRDQRLILLAAANLVVVTPPAYRKLILRAGGNTTAATGRAAGAGTAALLKDGGPQAPDAGA